LVLKLLLVLQ
jgi:hypothetical protein